MWQSLAIMAALAAGMAGCRADRGTAVATSRPAAPVTVAATTTPATAPATAAPAVCRLVVEADIDGSDELHLSPRGVAWVHKLWGWPSNVVVNGRPWDVQAGQTTLKELGLNFAPGEWNRAGVRVVSKEGRDTVAVEPSGDEVVIYFADSENGAGRYHVVVEFGE